MAVSTPLTRTHPETGARLIRGVRSQTVRYGAFSRTVDVPGWYPAEAGDANGIHSGSDLLESDQAFRDLRDLYSARIRQVRKKLGLTQESAGHVIGGGRRAFQKYESGKTPPSDAAVGLIELLDRHPEEVERLRAMRG